MHVHSIQSHVVWFDSIRKAITFEKEQVWLLLLHLTLNSIDYTTAFDNRSFHSFFLFRHSFQWAGALFEINHKCSSSTQRWQTHTHIHIERGSGFNSHHLSIRPSSFQINVKFMRSCCPSNVPPMYGVWVIVWWPLICEIKIKYRMFDVRIPFSLLQSRQ